MSFLSKLFGSKKAVQDQQAVIVYLDNQGLARHIYETYDLATLEDQLAEAIEEKGIGEFDGNEIGITETVLYMYGANAQTIFAAIEPILDTYPLCRNARVIIRSGPPGAVQREVRIPFSGDAV